MAKFNIQDVQSLESCAASPLSLNAIFGEMILSSTRAWAKVEAMNPETGEYQVVLRGTLDTEETEWEEEE